MLCSWVTFSYQAGHLYEALCKNVLRVHRVGVKACKFRPVTHHPAFSQLGLTDRLCLQLQHEVKSASFCLSLTNPNRIFQRLQGLTTTQRLVPAVCHTAFSCGTGAGNQSADYKLCRSMCSSVWEKLSVSLWIWLWLNWHCSSPRSERGFAQRVLQHCCDCVGEGKAGVCSLWFILKCGAAHTVRTCAAPLVQ